MAVAEQVAGFIAVSYGFIFGLRNESTSASILFIVLVYVFTYAGVSWSIPVCLVDFLMGFFSFNSCFVVGGLFSLASKKTYMVVYSINPNRLASENQIIFLRYFRTSENELRY
jgi:hypothetical protein